jgi:hypothetical protein
MPAKKSPNTTQKNAGSKAPKPEPVQVAQPVEAQEASGPKYGKPGRTILINTTTDNFDNSVLTALVGYQSTTQSRNPRSFFVVFDTPANAQLALESLSGNSLVSRIKFLKYRVFFHINGLTDSSDYDLVKQDIISYIESHTGSSVLFFKLYRNNNKYIGLGDLTVDTCECMQLLLSREQSGLKNWNTGSYSGTFYHFRRSLNEKEQERT